jgi:hypothetical protein
MTRGLTVLESYRHLSKNKNLSDQEIFECHVLGWCIEIVSFEEMK